MLAGSAAAGSLPSANAPLEDYSSHFRDYHDRILAGWSVASLGLAFTLCFLTGLWRILRDEDQAADNLATLALIASALRVGLVYVAATFLLVPAYRFGLGDPEAARTLADAYAVTLVLSAYPTIFSTAAFGVAVMRGEALPHWLGWPTLFVAAAHLFGASALAQTGPFAPSGFIATLLMPALYYAWIVMVSIALLVVPTRRP